MKINFPFNLFENLPFFPKLCYNFCVMRKVILSALILLCGLCALCACNCNTLPEGTYIVKYIIDGKELYSAYAVTGEEIGMPEIEPREGMVFKGWYLNDDYIEKWDFENDTVTQNTRLYAYWIPTEQETFNLVYYDGSELINYETVEKGGLPSAFYPEEKFGYEFEGWKHDDKLFDFSQIILDDYALTAVWKPVTYSVKFIAENEVVKEIFYTVEDENPTIPEVPEKPHYTAEWENFQKYKTTEVHAIYKPIIYKATFIDGDDIIYETNYTVEDTVVFPALPPKEGYLKQWESVIISGGNITVNSIVTPITYTATFKADGTVVAVREFTVEDKNISPPAVPPREGYEGDWEDKPLTANDIVINAVYTIKVYQVTFIIDDKIVSVRNFQIDNMHVDEPEIPEKEGFIARWQSYELTLQDITVRAEYLPVTYQANFYADGELIESVPFTLNDTEIKQPQVPEKIGYCGEWEDFELVAHDIDINAVYSPILYRIKFVCDKEIISEQVYTVEFKQITVPDPIEKDGFTVKWENFSLSYGDLIVNAIYEPVIIDDFKDEFTYSELSDGTLEITGYDGNETEIIVPTLHENKRIKAISKQAFMNRDFTKVIIREGIESIGDEAFQSCTKLTDISLPDSLKSIGKYCFAFCGLTSINLPDRLRSIGDRAFTQSRITSITIPNEVKQLNDIFYYCTELKSVIIGNGITVIPSQAFFNCSALESVYLPSKVKVIEPEVFTNCTSLTSVIFEDKNGWSIQNEAETVIKKLSPEKLSNESLIIDYFTNIYYSRYWIKE